MIYRVVTFFLLMFAMNFAYSTPTAPEGCETWTPCSGDLEDCVKNQCKSGSVWVWSPTSYCCIRTQQYCKNFIPCSKDGWSGISSCNGAICGQGNGMRYQSGVYGCCDAWESSQCQTSCDNTQLVKTKSWFSISGKVVQCVKDTLTHVFFSPDCHSDANLLPKLQSYLKNVVYLMMVLYVVLFGMNLAVSPQEFNKKQFFTFILKVSLVFYFSIGAEYKGQTQQGLVDIVYKGGLGMMESFSSFILTGAINNGLCDYTTKGQGASNEHGYDPGDEYLAIWDSLDCRVAYYLGMGNLFITLGDSETNYANSVSNAKQGTIFGLSQLVLPLIFAFEIIDALVIIVFAVLVLALAIYFVHFYVIAMIGLTVTAYLGVIMVPMVLFSFTKKFFDNWLNVILSFIIQPCVIVAMLALMLMAMDQVFYTCCQFTSTGLTWAWKLASTQASSECLDSLGGKLYAPLVEGNPSWTQSKDYFFFPMTIFFSDSYWKSLLPAFVKMIFFSYLFLLFAEGAGDLAAQLTSGPSVGQLATNLGTILKNLVNGITGGGGGKKQGQDSKKQGVTASGSGSAKRSTPSVSGKK